MVIALEGGVTPTGAEAPAEQRPAITPPAVIAGLLALLTAIAMIHWAELVLGGRRGHTAMANTSVPVGAFSALLAVLAISAAVGALSHRWGLSQRELIVVYVMATTGSVLASSGAIHFIVPELASPYYLATPENEWAQFHEYIPEWIAPSDPRQLRPFFEGGPLPVDAWLGPGIIWCGFIFVFALCTLSLSAIVRGQWIRRERLTFPTVYVPLEVTARSGGFWRNPVALIGMAIPFLLGGLNTLNRNFPQIPKVELRNVNLSRHFTSPPWNAMGGLRLSFYPFVIGIAYLLTAEVTFSCWFFHLARKLSRVLAAAFGVSEWGTGGLSRFPFAEHQGAGAFVGLTVLSIWVGRAELATILRETFSPDAEGRSSTPRWAVVCLLLSFGAMVGFAQVAGMSTWLAALTIGLSLVYLTAATRIRAETGDAWLFGPRVDPSSLIVETAGARRFGPRDLTVMAFLANISSYDLRCVVMPHQLDGYKLAHELSIDRSRMTLAMGGATAVGVPVAFWGALWVWHLLGATAKGEVWRLRQGQRPFEALASYLQAPQPADLLGLIFVGGGLVVTLGLFAMRTRFLWWPFHPVGYAVANTPSMGAQWFPFLLAWAAKSLILRYGGPRLYRRALPFFLGLVVGDLINGGFFTTLGFFIEGMQVYPMNW
ncbi:MAG: DUF6785 family protein [Armatimonadota bacterium]|nr:DUF6785 family protein [Armatimonadota bacterium]